MRQLLPMLLMFVLAVLLCGCPYDSPYNLDEAPQENIDESLVGEWQAIVAKPSDDTHTIEEPVTVIFAKRSDKEYDFAITDNISELKPYQVIVNDSIKGSAYITSLAGKRFLNAFVRGRVYLAELVIENHSISIYPLAEYFTSKFIKNSRELRTAVEFHYKMRLNPGYDQSFALKNLHKTR